MKRKADKLKPILLAGETDHDDQNVAFEANLGFPVGYRREENFMAMERSGSATDIEEILDYLSSSL